MPILEAEFDKRENWVALPPGGAPPARSACGRSTPTPSWCCTRSASLRISQRAVPLELSHRRRSATRRSRRRPGSRSRSTTARAGAEGAGARAVRAPRSSRTSTTAAKLSAPRLRAAGWPASTSRSAGTDTRTTPRGEARRAARADHHRHQLQGAPCDASSTSASAWFAHLLGSNATARSALSTGDARRKRRRSPTKVTAEHAGLRGRLQAATTPRAAGAGVHLARAGARTRSAVQASRPDARPATST